MQFSVTTDPTVEPVTLAEAKDQLSVEDSEFDSLIEDKIAAARDWVQNYLNLAIIEQTITLQDSGFTSGDYFTLPRSNLLTVDSITYVDDNGVTQALAASVYGVDTLATPGRVYLKYDQSWPSTLGQYGAVTVVYAAGYPYTTDKSENVPMVIKQSILMIVADMFKHRESTDINIMASAPVATTVKALLSPIRLANSND